MCVGDYEPCSDDGMRYGDYLTLPDSSQQERDPWNDWDHADLRLNWGEPIHWDLDMMFMFRVGENDPSYLPVGPTQYLTMTCTRKEAAIPPKNLSQWLL
ncbi:NADH dehydrogenase [ubiquinone] 1 beta subcomplex subunit 8, mitochondrial [Tupaia chinensis]|uniref:NADH dehydrogenase [ubiquinone] 1 beta subcomplex subunit 8, mitochondrial n=1 Tax=Tupaia chinensis TaxID=246437 RepID=L9LCX7_TUPCH|nr:NADH dehydrogenase [ubiquinone] 1 beta subcomplex subunit 8, mitochondrial [Tupaia chinensis]